MAKTVFADKKIFTQAKFVFETSIKSDLRVKDDRGNYRIGKGENPMVVEFFMKPKSKGYDQREDRGFVEEDFEAFVVSNAGKLPSILIPGAIGVGELNGKYCELRIESISPSSVYPIVRKILGDKIECSISYKVLGKI